MRWADESAGSPIPRPGLAPPPAAPAISVDLRLECLKLACGAIAAGSELRDALTLSDVFAEYVIGKRAAGDPLPGDPPEKTPT